MTESNALTPLVKSLLDKPIHQLTEDDIAQLTREDCRRYLKDKGMRRPSWNKSQAIQQVIMLKSLLETTPDSEEEAGSRKRLRVLCDSYRRENADSISETVPKGVQGDVENCVSAEETTPFSEKSVEELDVNSEPRNPRTSSSTKVPMGQMTIFYSGKVNVYNDMPADKAQAIMHIAASPPPSRQEQPIGDARMSQPLASLKSVGSRACVDSAAVFSPLWQRVTVSDNPRVCGEESYMLYEGNPAEGPSSTRKASVQRYLEKKKDRFKSRTKAGMTSCASLDIYFNHEMMNAQVPSLKTNQCALPPIRPPRTPTRCSSADSFSVTNCYPSPGLNSKGGLI